MSLLTSLNYIIPVKLFIIDKKMQILQTSKNEREQCNQKLSIIPEGTHWTCENSEGKSLYFHCTIVGVREFREVKYRETYAANYN